MRSTSGRKPISSSWCTCRAHERRRTEHVRGCARAVRKCTGGVACSSPRQREHLVGLVEDERAQRRRERPVAHPAQRLGWCTAHCMQWGLRGTVCGSVRHVRPWLVSRSFSRPGVATSSAGGRLRSAAASFCTFVPPTTTSDDSAGLWKRRSSSASSRICKGVWEGEGKGAWEGEGKGTWQGAARPRRGSGPRARAWARLSRVRGCTCACACTGCMFEHAVHIYLARELARGRDGERVDAACGTRAQKRGRA